MPARFYFQVEGAGNIEPDGIIQEGIKELQRKLATLIQGLGDGDSAMNGEYEGPRSPDMDVSGGWQDQQQGYTTPYGNGGGGGGAGGNVSAWGGGATSYGTPYGNSGSGGW